ncbi:NADH-quinone oxidoreductase subunit A [Blochmannia endosymbiont of Colobopsis nipponica]|uniref:NADH-quinone oxidoreductase subunit A n=1 Tax=Blochmannia endosymbiont of Colobopsis nipponica TaxID=2681987 RepID=UPI00177C19E6|nr:NADH-quinone oxidoreductase subunit A [Blochmannia endosymbiont of Colobopsis nipponica]QOI10972.1 NADH-quinone oxidoreductase subunit A [Blochmannia endosymbiont of Colobopsis nipponica]
MESNWGLIIFFLGALSICFIMLLCGFLLGERSRYDLKKESPFESGIDSVGSARLNFSIKFYLISVIFVIFDAESLYLYTWAVVIREAGWSGFIESSIFIFILLITLIYLFRVGIFDWIKRPISYRINNVL